MRSSPELNRFLLMSPCWFVGEFENDICLLTPALPEFNPTRSDCGYLPGPYRRSYISLSFKTALPKKEDGEVLLNPEYGYVAEAVADLLSAFYGKLVINCGYTERLGQFRVPTIPLSPQPFFAYPPFNEKPRASTDMEPNLQNAESLVSYLLSCLLKQGELNSNDVALLSACSFYRASLESFAKEPIISFTLLHSSLEALIPLFDFSEAELSDQDLNYVIQLLEDHCPDANRAISIIRNGRFQTRKKSALVVQKSADLKFFQTSEAIGQYPGMTPDCISDRIKASYDLRSRFLHTGASHGFWSLAFHTMNAEIIIGEPIIQDRKLKKLVKKAPTLAGLERIVHYCIFKKVVAQFKLH